MEKRAFMAILVAASSGVDGVWKQYPLNARDPLSLSKMLSF
jgi:hypothetical protein